MGTTNNYENILVNIKDDIKDLKRRMDLVESQMRTLASSSELGTSEARMKNLIAANSSLITLLQEKIGTINIPEETRWYLENSEVEDFRANFAKLRAMIADVESLYQNIVAYTASNIS